MVFAVGAREGDCEARHAAGGDQQEGQGLAEGPRMVGDDFARGQVIFAPISGTNNHPFMGGGGRLRVPRGDASKSIRRLVTLDC